MVTGVLKTDVENAAIEVASVLSGFTTFDAVAKAQSASTQRDRAVGQVTPVSPEPIPSLRR